MFISLELVPRERSTFVTEVTWAKEHTPAITHLNIPDLTRLETRSWEALTWVEGCYPVIVHIRACDVQEEDLESFYHTLKKHGVSHVLVVKGDEDENQKRGMTSLEMLAGLRRLDPTLCLYAALDPYRQGIIEEMAYVEQKLKAGATAFLTQPFFEKDIFQEYVRACRGLSVWWGVSPILSQKSLVYWREKNRVPLSESYDLSLEGNIRWARFVMERVAGETEYALYLMPIRVDITSYLPPIFETLS
ncbi:MAG: methylenetetrahydrofolate reductase [Brevinematales bacterium]|nr:methylenetetrahydrofolate reductase [Brevinematales bacterium]